MIALPYTSFGVRTGFSCVRRSIPISPSCVASAGAEAADSFAGVLTTLERSGV